MLTLNLVMWVVGTLLVGSFFLLVWAVVKTGSDADDYLERLMETRQVAPGSSGPTAGR